MRIDLAGRTALVTGSTQGIGLAIATGLAGAGARVAVNGRTAGKVSAADDAVRAAAAEAGAGPADVVYLASPLSSATTGGAVRVDGGYVDAILP